MHGILSVLTACAGSLFVACGNETMAGKTTTTSNGGDLVAIGRDGKPLAGCRILAARSWDSAAGKPGIIDTLYGDSAGVIDLPNAPYAFVEIQNWGGTLGAWLKRVPDSLAERTPVILDSLKRLEGRWADRARVGASRLFLDSSFRSAALASSDGSFDFGRVPQGVYALKLDADSKPVRPMGVVELRSNDLRYMGSGNIILAGDTSLSPLWIDDFESGTIWPMLKRSVPGVSPWFMWLQEADLILPATTDPDSIHRAIGFDSSRGGTVFHSRFTPTGTGTLVAAGITNMEVDLRARGEVCFGYRVDSPVSIEFQRDSVSGVRPYLSTSIPASSTWRDTCVSTSVFQAGPDTPDSLRTWDSFAKRVLVLQFVATSGATHLDLDDIRLR